MIGIYKITSPNKKIYIGQSINIEKRFAYYKRMACKAQPKIYRSLKKYGVDNHKFEIICECEISELNDKERYYQELYSASGKNGLNSILTTSKDRSGEFSAEHKEKLSLAKKGKKTGRKVIHTEESKTKIRLANTGRIKSKETIEKHRKSVTGLKRTSQQIEKFSNLKKGVLNPMFGKKIKESSRALQQKKISGELNYLSKIILNTETGVFYYGLNEAAKSINMIKGTLWSCLKKRKINKTSFIYV